MRNALIRRGRRWLYIVHRWIGIATCLLFAMWFISGLVMMYVAFPRLTDSERLAALPVIPWSKVRVTPDRAMAIAGVERYPRDLRLSMMDDTPVYRVTGWKGGTITISATDGSVIDRITPDQALAIAAHHPHALQPRLIETITRDQWSVTSRFDPLRPLYLIGLGDADGTELYVSSRTGEIALDTTRCERIWNWLGSIPHWIYPTVLRKDGSLWRDVVLWISGICLVVAVTGFWIGVLRLRLMRRYADGAISPYRGWMAWHHIAGLIGGICVLTWMFSGWLSLNPGGAFSGRGVTREIAIGYSGHDTADIVAGFQSSPSMPAVEARFVWIGGHRLMLLDDGNGGRSIADPVTGARMTLSRDEVIAAARHAMPGAAMTSARQLDEPDAYWYTLHQARELPGIADRVRRSRPHLAAHLPRHRRDPRAQRRQPPVLPLAVQRAAQPRCPAAAAHLAGARRRGVAAIGGWCDYLDQRDRDRLAPVAAAEGTRQARVGEPRAHTSVRRDYLTVRCTSGAGRSGAHSSANRCPAMIS
ncbi:hypothetical protein ACVIHH_005548 [Bradyrhizobium sp. USDA 4518]